MTRQIMFLTLLLGSSVYAATRGGRPEQIGAATLFGGAWFSVLVASPFAARFHHVEIGILLTDAAILGIFLWLSLRSARFWPIWIAALLGAEITVHMAVAIVPTVVPQAYMRAAALWSWLAQFILIAGTWRHRTRKRRQRADASWRT